MGQKRDNKGRFTKKDIGSIWTPVSGGIRGLSFGSDPYGNSEPKPIELVNAYEDVVYACADLIANNVAGVNVKLVATTSTGQGQPQSLTKGIGSHERKALLRDYSKHTRKAINVQEVVEHPLLDLLDRPNPYQNLHKLLGITQTYLELIGSAFWYLARNQFGEVCELWALPSHCVSIETQDGHVAGYTYTPVGGSEKVTYSPDDVIHFRFFNPTDPYTGFGVSPARAVWQKIGLLRQEQSSWQSVLNNMAYPSALVTPGGEGEMWTDGQAERVAKQIEERFRYGNEGGVWVVQDSINYTPISKPPESLAAVSMYDTIKTAICNVYHVPRTLLDMEDSNYASAQTAMRFFQMNCLKPRVVNLMDTITHHLCPSRLFLATDEIVEPDRTFELQRTSALYQAGLITVNEARGTQGLDPVSGGEKFLYQLIGGEGGGGTMGTLPSFQEGKSTDWLGYWKKNAPTKTKATRLTSRVADPKPLTSALQGFFRKLASQITLKDTGELRTKSFFPFEEMTKELAETITPALRLSYEEGSKDVAAQLGGVPLLDVLNLTRAVNRAALVLADSTLNTTNQDVAGAVQATREALEAGLAAHEANDQLTARIKDIFTDLSERRAYLIAETESARAKMAGEVMEIQESGITAKKVWLADSQCCDKCRDVNGVAKALNEPFAVEGTGPYSRILHPPFHPACRCALTYEIED